MKSQVIKGLFQPRKKSRNMGATAPKVSKGRSQTSSVSIALWSPPQRRNPCVREKAAMVARPAVRSRPSGATQHRCWKSSLGGASEDAQSYWQGRFAACAFVGDSFGLVGRETVGALPQTPQGTLSLDPARGRRKRTKSPLDPFLAVRLEHTSQTELFCCFFLISYPVPRCSAGSASP